MDERQALTLKARIAESAERFDEMSMNMKKVALLGEELSIEERNLLSVAFKNSVGSRRSSWRIIYSLEAKEKSKKNVENEDLAQRYRSVIEAELTRICEDVLSILTDYLIPSATTAESRVFYYKMKGDYLRYLSEFPGDEKIPPSAIEAQKNYEGAMKIATDELNPCHPIRLGLALNFSVFYYEILRNPEMACSMASKAFNEAIVSIDCVPHESYKDSTLIMQLLRDNLALWASDDPKEGEKTENEPSNNEPDPKEE